MALAKLPRLAVPPVHASGAGFAQAERQAAERHPATGSEWRRSQERGRCLWAAVGAATAGILQRRKSQDSQPRVRLCICTSGSALETEPLAAVPETAWPLLRRAEQADPQFGSGAIAEGLAGWRRALEAGQVWEDAAGAHWPQRSLRQQWAEVLVQLGLPRLTRRYPQLVDPLLYRLLEMAVQVAEATFGAASEQSNSKGESPQWFAEISNGEWAQLQVGGAQAFVGVFLHQRLDQHTGPLLLLAPALEVEIKLASLVKARDAAERAERAHAEATGWHSLVSDEVKEAVEYKENLDETNAPLANLPLQVRRLPRVVQMPPQARKPSSVDLGGISWHWAQENLHEIAEGELDQFVQKFNRATARVGLDGQASQRYGELVSKQAAQRAAKKARRLAPHQSAHAAAALGQAAAAHLSAIPEAPSGPASHAQGFKR
ncbi:unnamed protein product [Prorocentrum cordatum]|uniref:Uncharacterized protein n=1 Tax=Prorocentrum cordatum TaxID=2364126 RepID=A0ABN9XWD5_9DINO|nr:unnamed protein product [Polarella glacialis]